MSVTQPKDDSELGELVAWAGVPLEQMTREELIEALKDTAKQLHVLQIDPVARKARAKARLEQYLKRVF